MYIGIAVCAILALVATWIAGLQHIVGGPMVGLLLGILVTNIAGDRFTSKIKKGAAFSSKMILRVAIVLAGGTLSFATIVGAGSSALPFILLSIVLAFAAACLIGRYVIPVPTNTRILVASGTSICGGTAIATISAVLGTDEDETAYAMAAIFLFDILATFLWPYLAPVLGLGPSQFSILAGIAINDVASVTAAGATYDSLMGAAAMTVGGVTGGELAVVVKLTRVAMLIFVALAVMGWSMWSKRKTDGAEEMTTGSAVRKIVKAFPLFILGFLAMAIANTIFDFSSIHIFGTTLAALLKTANKYLITVALVGVGCKIGLRDLFTKGVRPVLLGGCTWLVVAIFTLTYVTVIM